MDQKNTIVKCKAHPNCLFNHNGVCDNYVINIGADGKCESYIETELQGVSRADCKNAQKMLEKAGVTLIEPKGEAKRGQRVKCNVYDDATFNLCSSACHNYDFKGASLYCQLRQEYLGSERLMKPCDLFVKAKNDKIAVKELNKPNKNQSVIKSISDHLCDIRCVSAHYAEDRELYCALIQDFPERPLRCSAYDDGGEE